MHMHIKKKNHFPPTVELTDIEGQLPLPSHPLLQLDAERGLALLIDTPACVKAEAREANKSGLTGLSGSSSSCSQ